MESEVCGVDAGDDGMAVMMLMTMMMMMMMIVMVVMLMIMEEEEQQGLRLQILRPEVKESKSNS